MERSNKSRTMGAKAGLILSTALVSVAFAGVSASHAAPRAEQAFSKAQRALEKGKATKAISYAEQAVQAEPRNASFRALLGAAYLEAGRFEAAATSFKDALDLGNTDPRTTLSFALASIANGDSNTAIATLRANEASIDPADFGLALALAGNPEQGVHVLVNAVRSGQNSAKMRQNLAYSYALAGNWRAARIMAAEDVPADQLDARLTDWASNAKPEDVTKRVAKLLGVTPSVGGQPAHLALANFPDPATAVAANVPMIEAPASPVKTAAPVKPAPVKAAPSQPVIRVAASGNNVEVSSVLRATGAKAATAASAATSALTKPAPRFVSRPVVQKLPSRASSAPRVARAVPVAPKPAVSAPAAPSVSTPVTPTRVAAAPAAAAPRYISKPIVQSIPTKAEEKKAPRRVASSSSQRRMAAPTPVRASTPKSNGTHLVQLGSYSSRSDAKAGWSALQRKFPQLRGRDVVITKAQVKGKIYYRVAAAGFGARDARSMCGTVKSKGRGCFAYAATNPPKGAIDNGVRIAAR